MYDSLTISQFVVELVTAASSTAEFRMGLWNHDPTTNLPSTLILDAGTINVGSGTAAGSIALSVSQSLSAGVYWFGGASQNVASGAPVIRGAGITQTLISGSTIPMGTSTPALNSCALGVYQSGVTGSFGSTFSVSGLTNASANAGVRLILKVA